MWGQFTVYSDTVCAQLSKHKVAEPLIVKYYETFKSVSPSKAAAVLQLVSPATAASLSDIVRPLGESSSTQYAPTAAKRIPLVNATTDRPSKPKNYQTLTEAMQISRRQAMLPPNKPEGKKETVRYLHLDPLKSIWNPPLGSTIREDWMLWIDTLRLDCLKSAPARALNACSNLADHYPVIAKYVNFQSFWLKIVDLYVNLLIQLLTTRILFFFRLTISF